MEKPPLDVEQAIDLILVYCVIIKLTFRFFTYNNYG
jgi:hypothetical protein